MDTIQWPYSATAPTNLPCCTLLSRWSHLRWSLRHLVACNFFGLCFFLVVLRDIRKCSVCPFVFEGGILLRCEACDEERLVLSTFLKSICKLTILSCSISVASLSVLLPHQTTISSSRLYVSSFPEKCTILDLVRRTRPILWCFTPALYKNLPKSASLIPLQ